MKTTAEKVAVMQAFIEGKKIQTMSTMNARHNRPWADLVATNPTWDWGVCDYRVRPMRKDYINPDHVSKDYLFLTRNGNGQARLWKEKPEFDAGRLTWYGNGSIPHYGLNANIFASYKMGDNSSEDSLVALEDLRDVES